ncbi:MAG TPA: L,D-transpeptidase [Acidimicrobiia bacterium]|nr:L,D-transpeptidase [Acidimicrobiia bacterium]
MTLNRRIAATCAILLMVTACGSVASSELPDLPPATATTSPETVHAATAETVNPVAVSSLTRAASVQVPAPAHGQALVAHSQGELEVFPSPASPGQGTLMPATTILGTPQVYLVEGLPSSGWVRLALPGRPNGSTGWALISDLEFEIVGHSIKVDLSDRTLALIENGEEVLLAPIAIGSPANPTPTGRFYVTDIVQLADPGSAWGPYALGISARSDTITEFNGGDGIIGIHGTNRPGTIGKAVSLGCIRLDNELITHLAALVELGTPVVISY